MKRPSEVQLYDLFYLTTIGAENRLRNLRTLVKEKTTSNTLYISIENGVFEQKIGEEGTFTSPIT